MHTQYILLALLFLRDGRSDPYSIKNYEMEHGFFSSKVFKISQGMLFWTADGGKNWDAQLVDAGSECEPNFYLNAMRFKNSREGLLVVWGTYEGAQTWMTLATADGGKSWIGSPLTVTTPNDTLFLAKPYISRSTAFVTLYQNALKKLTLFSRS